MNTPTQRFHDWDIIKLEGRVDSANSNSVCEELGSFLAKRDRKVAIDLTGVEFVNLPTIRFLNQLACSFKTQNGLLGIFGASDRTRRHIEIFGDLNLIHLVRTKDQLMTELLLVDRVRLSEGKNNYEDSKDDSSSSSFSKASAL